MAIPITYQGSSYDFVVNDAKVRIVQTNTDGTINHYTLGRETNNATFYNEGASKVFTISSDDYVPALRIKEISQVASITDNRDGATVIIAVPATLTLFFETIVENSAAPFFFSDGATESTLSAILAATGTGGGGATEAGQDEIITELNESNDTLSSHEILLQAILRQTEVNQNIIEELKIHRELLKELNT